MRTIIGVLVFAWFGIVPQMARAAEAPQMVRAAQAPAQDNSEVETLKRLGQEMGDAMVARDIATLDRMFADDWESVGSSGKVVKKESVLQGFKSGGDTLDSFVLGPMDVLVLGNIASVKGTVTEKRHHGDKDASGEFVYMDLLEKRAGRWVVIRSSGMRVK
jgi:ketosteroid isomerase-like protein